MSLTAAEESRLSEGYHRLHFNHQDLFVSTLGISDHIIPTVRPSEIYALAPVATDYSPEYLRAGYQELVDSAARSGFNRKTLDRVTLPWESICNALLDVHARIARADMGMSVFEAGIRHSLGKNYLPCSIEGVSFLLIGYLDDYKGKIFDEKDAGHWRIELMQELCRLPGAKGSENVKGVLQAIGDKDYQTLRSTLRSLQQEIKSQENGASGFLTRLLKCRDVAHENKEALYRILCENALSRNLKPKDMTKFFPDGQPSAHLQPRELYGSIRQRQNLAGALQRHQWKMAPLVLLGAGIATYFGMTEMTSEHAEAA